LYRRDLATRAPAAVAAFARLAGAIDAAAMAAMNAKAKIEKVSESAVAAEFVSTKLGIAAAAQTDTMWTRLLRNTLDHLALVGISLGAAILIAVPLGIVAARRADVGQAILAVTGILQTIPSLALFVFMIPILGIGGPPAIVALFLYSLLPIVRNTHAGLTGIAPSVRESVEALGLSPGAQLRLVELPLAARSIVAGIKTSAVINIGTATLGALIGAGGYGQPILTGIRLDDVSLILEGAAPAALMALAAQGLFEIGERLVVPRGLRLARG
jgi:osmoprotectant transport system permease protein